MKDPVEPETILSDNDDLSTCERGDGSSAETASLTKEPSLVSSFSNDTQEEDCVANSPAKIRRLRLRHGDGVPGPFPTPFEIDFTEKELLFKRNDNRKFFEQRSGKPTIKLFHYALLVLLFLPGFCLTVSAVLRGPDQWRMPSQRSVARLTRKIQQRSMKAKDAGLTLRLSGGRIHLLHQSLETLAYCDTVRQVQIDWTAKDESFPTPLLSHGSQKVVVARSSTKLATDGVLLLEEGVRLSCQDLERAFQQWQLDSSRIVGFLPDGETLFSQLSDRAAIVHRYYLSNRPRHTGDKCQHFALSVFITAVSEKYPVVIASDLIKNRQYDTEDPEVDCIPALSMASGKAPMPATATRYLGRHSH